LHTKLCKKAGPGTGGYTPHNCRGARALRGAREGPLTLTFIEKIERKKKQKKQKVSYFLFSSFLFIVFNGKDLKKTVKMFK